MFRFGVDQRSAWVGRCKDVIASALGLAPGRGRRARWGVSERSSQGRKTPGRAPYDIALTQIGTRVVSFGTSYWKYLISRVILVGAPGLEPGTR